MAKVLWFGDAGCHTGFARVTHSIGERLVAMGHDISVMAFNHRGDYWPTTLKLYRPNSMKIDDIWGMARVVELLGKVEPDIVVILHDAPMILSFLFENAYDTQKYLLKYRPIITYIPVDGHNQPPLWPNVLTKVTDVATMSKFGQEQYPGSTLVYHGMDTTTFHPVSEKHPITISNGDTLRTKQDCKRAFGYDPDGFLVLRVDKNSGRKDFAATWKALIPVMKRHSDIQVHFHTEGRNFESGVLMNALFEREATIKKRFFLPDLHNSYIGWTEEDLVALYNAADLFVSTSRGEGFGLTLAESLACGVPVIAQNVSAIPETVGLGGILLEPEREITVPSGQDLWLADIDAFTEQIEHLYGAGGVRRKLGEQGREHVSHFSWDQAAEQFDELISKNIAQAEAAASADAEVAHAV